MKASQRCPHFHPWKPWRWCATWQRGVNVAEELVSLISWPWTRGISLGYPCGPNKMTTILTCGRGSQRGSVRVTLHEKDLSSFKDGGKGPRAKERGKPPETGKGREMILLKASWRGSPADTVILAQWHPFQTSDLQNCKIINECYFKRLHWWQLVTAEGGSKHRGPQQHSNFF